MVIWRPLWLIDDTDLAWVGEDYGAFAWLYEYDVYGNLVYAGSPCVGEYEAAYDAFGRRVWERIAPTGQSAIETHFVYDGDALVLELSPNGQPLVQYVWGLLGPIARVDLQTPSNTRYYVLDARGHARAMVDSTGSVTDDYEHDAWGNLLPGSFGSTPNPFKWNAAAGYQHVPFTGLYHVGAREYDPRTARWLQRDPIGQSSGDPNVYRYCGNNAVNLSDPSGLDTQVYEYNGMIVVRTTMQFRGSKANLSNCRRVVAAMLKAWNKGFKYNGKPVFFEIDWELGGKAKADFDQVHLLPGTAISHIEGTPSLGVGAKCNLYSGRPDYDWMVAHEYGHLIGLEDEYKRIGPDATRPRRGWEINIMAARNKPVDQRNINEILRRAKARGAYIDLRFTGF